MKAAHRVAYALTHGAIPDGLFVLHSCTNKACVNPKHLELGRKHKSGEGKGNAKLTEIEVRAIRNANEWGCASNRQLAKEYAVSKSTIRRIVKRYSWQHI